MKTLILALLLVPCAYGQTKIQGSSIQIGGSTSVGGVTSVKASGSAPLVGDVTFSCGSGLFCSQSGNTISIATSGVFSITSFTGGSVVEIGTSVVNPSFAAVYSTLPVSAQITNTEGIGSPTVLTTPFTSGTITGTFTHSTVTTTTFTLSATQGTTQTATQTIGWQPSIFGGVGAPGATSSITASGTTAVLSTGDAIARAQLGTETVGESFGPFAPSGQCVYLLLKGGAHTFIDSGTGFPFAFNSPIAVSFVNAQGVTVSMFLYQSTNPLTGTFTPKVAS